MKFMTIQPASVVAVLVTSMLGASAATEPAQDDAGQEWASAIASVSGELVRGSLRAAAGRPGAELRLDRLTPEGASAGDPLDIHLPEVVAGQWIRGALDLREAPGGGLLAAASFADGGGNTLRVWSIDVQRESGKRSPAARTASRAFSAVRIPVLELLEDGSTTELTHEYAHFEEPRLLVVESTVSVLVSAVRLEEGLVTSGRAIVQLQLSPDLRSMARADIVGLGSDPRVHGSAGHWWLSLRGVDDSDVEHPARVLRLLRSSDGRAWSAVETSALPAPVPADYALGVADAEPWIATPADGDRRTVQLWRNDRSTQVWQLQGTLALSTNGSSTRAESVWFPASGEPAARPQIAFPSLTGLRVVRW